MSEDIKCMSDLELAKWQSGWKERMHNDILAEREWQRRMIAHQLQEQYKLDERLSEAERNHAAALAAAAAEHAASIASNSRWWSLAAAVVGVLGTLMGAWLSRPESHTGSSQPSPAAARRPATASSSTAVSR